MNAASGQRHARDRAHGAGAGGADVVERWEQAGGSSLPPLVVREPLGRWLAAHGFGGDPGGIVAIGDGLSNATFALRRSDAPDLVLRRPPQPPLPPGAHDVLREARVLRGLAATAVPTPRVLAVCEDDRVIGAPFYVMEHLAGTVALLELPEALDVPDERRAVAERAVEALVAIHAVDTAAVGLELGRPSGYLERQLERHFALWEHSRTRELPAFDEVGRWLARNLPTTEEVTLVHGDYHLGNVLLAPDAPARVAAVLDWELATRGDPLADLGYLCAMWTQAGDPSDHPLERSTLTRRAGFPTRDELAAHYEAVSGRVVHDRAWYEILALWRAVVFMEGNYRRAAEGSTDNPFLVGFGSQVPRLAELARAAVEAADASSRRGAP